MEVLSDILQPIGVGLGGAAVLFLCIIGLVLSCLSISGTCTFDLPPSLLSVSGRAQNYLVFYRRGL